jgi:hypothetical protein
MEDNNILNRIFRKISDTINGGERSILDALSAIVPYTTASIPAYLTYDHTLKQMAFPDNIALLAAFTVEVLGVTAVSTSIRFWQWNRNHKTAPAPFWLAVTTYLFYIVITLSVNVILEIYAAERNPAVIWAIALFSLLSVPSGVLISVRAQFGEMLEDRREKSASKTGRIRTTAMVYNLNSDNSEIDDRFTGKHREVFSRVCACGCGKTFTTTFPNKTTINATHRKRLQRGRI